MDRKWKIRKMAGDAKRPKTVIVGSRQDGQDAAGARKRCRYGMYGGWISLWKGRKLKDACGCRTCFFMCARKGYPGKCCKRLCPVCLQKTILSDITSVKERPPAADGKGLDRELLLVHPLFGPKNSPDTDFCPWRLFRGQRLGKVIFGWLKNFSRQNIGCKTFRCDAETHDKAMAKIQNMNFYHQPCLFCAFGRRKKGPLALYYTIVFAPQGCGGKMLNRDAEMFGVLLRPIPTAMKLCGNSKKMLNVAAAGDIDLLCKRAQWWWPEDKT